MKSRLILMANTSWRRNLVLFRQKPRKFTPKHKQDGVNQEYDCIHTSSMNNYVTWGTLCIISLSTVVMLMSARIIHKHWGSIPRTNELLEHPVGASIFSITLCSFLVSFSVLVYRRSVVRIYYNHKNSFIAITRKWYLLHQPVEFTPRDVKLVKNRAIHWSNVSIKGTKYLMVDTDFKLNRYYNLIMGYELERDVD